MKSGFGFLNWNPPWERISRRWNPFFTLWAPQPFSKLQLKLRERLIGKSGFRSLSLSCSLLNGWGAHRVKKSMTDDYTNNRPFCLKVYDISTHKHLETLNGESLVVTSNRLLWVWAQLRQHSKARETRERLNFTRAHILFFVTKAATFLVSLLLLHDIFSFDW